MQALVKTYQYSYHKEGRVWRKPNRPCKALVHPHYLM